MTCTDDWENAFIVTPTGCAIVLLWEISAVSLRRAKKLQVTLNFLQKLNFSCIFRWAVFYMITATVGRGERWVLAKVLVYWETLNIWRSLIIRDFSEQLMNLLVNEINILNTCLGYCLVFVDVLCCHQGTAWNVMGILKIFCND